MQGQLSGLARRSPKKDDSKYTTHHSAGMSHNEVNSSRLLHGTELCRP